jgi:hypothetical protein
MCFLLPPGPNLGSFFTLRAVHGHMYIVGITVDLTRRSMLFVRVGNGV